jgi:hypothetical protein
MHAGQRQSRVRFANQDERRPIVWRSFRPEVRDQIPLRKSQRIGLWLPFRQMLVEPLHQVERIVVVNPPQCGDDGLRPGVKKRSREIRHAFLSLQASNRCFTCGKGDQVSIQPDSRDLGRFQIAVFIRRWVVAKNQGCVIRLFRVRDTVYREVNNPVPIERLGFESSFGRS